MNAKIFTCLGVMMIVTGVVTWGLTSTTKYGLALVNMGVFIGVLGRLLAIFKKR